MTLRGAIVGFGEVARHGHWPGYATSPDIDIVAVVDRTSVRRAVAADVVKVPAFASIAELAAGGPEIDFVDICTPPALHARPLLDALDHGWHVLCEKPFLLESADVDAARVRAAASNLCVLPVHNWKHAPIVREATRLLRAGVIGRLRRVEIEVLRLRDCKTADPDRPDWRRDPEIAGGGILMDHGWHAVYLTLHWFGEVPRRVGAVLHRPSPGAVEDEASVTVSFPSGDAAIVLTWNAEVRRNAMRLSGDRGDIHIDDGTLRVSAGDRRAATPFSPALSAGSHHDDWFGAMLPDVVAALRTPSRSRPLFEEASTCLSVIQQAYLSEKRALMASSIASR